MEDREWDLIEGVLESCWPGEWTDRTGPAYRLMLGGYQAGAVVAALHKHAAGRARFRPSVGEIAGALNADPGLPSWTEVEEALLGPSGILRTGRALPEGTHEVLVSFVERTGREALARRPLDDEDWGSVERKRLREDFERYVERTEDRRRHGLALESVGAPRGELRRLRPLAALGYGGSPELGSGE